MTPTSMMTPPTMACFISPGGGIRVAARSRHQPLAFSTSQAPCLPSFKQQFKQQHFISPNVPDSTHHSPLLLSAVNPVAVTTRPSLLALTLAFVAGGLFFSSVLGSIAAILGVGVNNVVRLINVLRAMGNKVWTVFCFGISETRKVLRMDGKWNFRKSWQTFKEKMRETRQVAADGVEAIRLEANRLSAAVGAPGLIPVQYMLDKLFEFTIATQLEEALKETLADIDNPNVRKLTLTEFSPGHRAPKLQLMRLYDFQDRATAFDVDLIWDSDFEAKINLYPRRIGLRVPVTVRNIKFEGCVRVGLAPMTHELPGYGASVISLTTVPKVGLDVDVAGGEITKVSWLRSELIKEIQNSIENELLWPKRMVIPSIAVEQVKNPKLLLTRSQLEEVEHTDPFLESEQAMSDNPMIKTLTDTLNPDKTQVPDLVDVFMRDDEQRLFDSLDKNKDGSVSQEEFATALGDEAEFKGIRKLASKLMKTK